MLKFIDSHCHIHFDEFKDDLDQIFLNSHENGVYKMLSVCTKITDIPLLKELCKKHQNCFFSIGIHPNETSFEFDKSILYEKDAVAIGETGLDYFYTKSNKDSQIKSFHTHIEASLDLKIPLIIHTRNADSDTIGCLKEHKDPTGVFHCFTGTKEMAQKGLDMGFFISFSGIITFPKAKELHEVVKYVPLDRILIETDSPYLAPVPFRGKRNEPSYVVNVAIQVANLKNISIEEVAEKTTNNCEKLFSI